MTLAIASWLEMTVTYMKAEAGTDKELILRVITVGV